MNNLDQIFKVLQDRLNEGLNSKAILHIVLTNEECTMKLERIVKASVNNIIEVTSNSIFETSLKILRKLETEKESTFYVFTDSEDFCLKSFNDRRIDLDTAKVFYRRGTPTPTTLRDCTAYVRVLEAINALAKEYKEQNYPNLLYKITVKMQGGNKVVIGKLLLDITELEP